MSLGLGPTDDRGDLDGPSRRLEGAQPSWPASACRRRRTRVLPALCCVVQNSAAAANVCPVSVDTPTGCGVSTTASASLADDTERWFEAGAAGGFIVLPADLHTGLDDFVDDVVRRLQDRAHLWKYVGTTLRAHLQED